MKKTTKLQKDIKGETLRSLMERKKIVNMLVYTLYI